MRRPRASGRRARLHQAKRTAPPPRTLLQVRCAFFTPPLPVARPWPLSDTRGGHAARCSVGGGVGGGTPRRAVAGQWGEWLRGGEGQRTIVRGAMATETLAAIETSASPPYGTEV